MTEALDDAHDRGFQAGLRAAAMQLASEVLRQLASAGEKDSAEFRAVALAQERALAVTVLRRVCEDYGDNDWPDDLHLADVIEKHLARHLDDETSER